MARSFTAHSLAYINEWQKNQYKNNAEYRDKKKEISAFHKMKKRINNLVSSILWERDVLIPLSLL